MGGSPDPELSYNCTHPRLVPSASPGGHVVRLAAAPTHSLGRVAPARPRWPAAPTRSRSATFLPAFSVRPRRSLVLRAGVSVVGWLALSCLPVET